MRRPIASDSHAQAKRPTALPIEMIETTPAATAAVTPVISSVIGAASEMIAMPAVTLRKRIAHSAYHCHFDSAPRRSKSIPERPLDATGADQPSGDQSAGGLRRNIAAP